MITFKLINLKISDSQHGNLSLSLERFPYLGKTSTTEKYDAYNLSR